MIPLNMTLKDSFSLLHPVPCWLLSPDQCCFRVTGWQWIAAKCTCGIGGVERMIETIPVSVLETNKQKVSHNNLRFCAVHLNASKLKCG